MSVKFYGVEIKPETLDIPLRGRRLINVLKVPSKEWKILRAYYEY